MPVWDGMVLGGCQMWTAQKFNERLIRFIVPGLISLFLGLNFLFRVHFLCFGFNFIVEVIDYTYI